jgi:PKD repeat protein
METLNLIYWCRVGLGVIAALLCVVGWALTNTLFATIFQGSSLAIIFYIITYYILKMKFITKVEKTSKLLMQGIGAYFMTWVVSWVLLLSLTVPTAAFTYSPKTNLRVGDSVAFDATASYDIKGHITNYRWIFVFSNGTVSNETETASAFLTHTFKVPANYTVFLYVIDTDGFLSSPQVASMEVKT